MLKPRYRANFGGGASWFKLSMRDYPKEAFFCIL